MRCFTTSLSLSLLLLLPLAPPFPAVAVAASSFGTMLLRARTVARFVNCEAANGVTLVVADVACSLLTIVVWVVAAFGFGFAAACAFGFTAAAAVDFGMLLLL